MRKAKPWSEERRKQTIESQKKRWEQYRIDHPKKKRDYSAATRSKRVERMAIRKTVTKGQNRFSHSEEDTIRLTFRDIHQVTSSHGYSGNHATIHNEYIRAIEDVLSALLKLETGLEKQHTIREFVKTSNLMNVENAIEDLIFHILQTDKDFLESLLPA
jgi:hypothetical protein